MIDQISAGDVNALPLNVVADNFGQFVNTTLSIGQDHAVPSEFKLYANYPNPFNPATIITYDLSEASQVELSVYDMRGRKIKNLFSGQQNPGQYHATWTGVDNFGIKLFTHKKSKNIHSNTGEILLTSQSDFTTSTQEFHNKTAAMDHVKY